MNEYLTPEERKELIMLQTKSKNYKSLTKDELVEIENRSVYSIQFGLDVLQKVMNDWNEIQKRNRDLSDDVMRLVAELRHLQDIFGTKSICPECGSEQIVTHKNNCSHYEPT